jgi:hypothetical protein
MGSSRAVSESGRQYTESPPIYSGSLALDTEEAMTSLVRLPEMLP